MKRVLKRTEIRDLMLVCSTAIKLEKSYLSSLPRKTDSRCILLTKNRCQNLIKKFSGLYDLLDSMR